MTHQPTVRAQLITAANGLTLLRVAVVAPLLLSLERQNLLIAIVLMSLAGVSDIADGKLARHTGTASPLGGILDAAADATLVLAVQAWLVVRGEWPGYLLFLSIGSILTFALVSARDRRMSPTKLGKYVGAVLMNAILLQLMCMAIAPSYVQKTTQIAGPMIAVYMTLTILENLLLSGRIAAGRTHVR